ncbi:MAG: SEL1-like repeat protein [Bradyrhizobiaceae bacterium]|nr:SEL1-like repeat protein [Bradyrhizobiaceae bacterium]
MIVGLAVSLLIAVTAGGGVAQTSVSVVEWRRAAEAGDRIAMRNLGSALMMGRGVEQNEREALRWLRQAADNGNGDAIAMTRLGDAYIHGRGVERDPREAARWIKMAADKNEPMALHNYGIMLRDGLGVEKNYPLSVNYFRRAGELGNVESFTNVGASYALGRGVRKDLVEAARWFRKAADLGSVTAFSNLGALYERGEGGFSKNRDEAIKYYRKAAEGGRTFAVERLKALNATPHDPKEVQQLLSDLGFNPGVIDGQPGAKTSQAIRDFQKSRGVNVDGQASLALVGRLRDALKQKAAANSTTAQGSRSSSAGGANFGVLKDLEKLDSLE